MKKLALLAMALLLLTLSGCAQDEGELMERTVIRVGSVSYTYADLLDTEASVSDYYQQMNALYQMYGIEPVTVTDEAIREEAINELAIQAIVLNKAHEMGLTQLTEDELRQISRSTTATMKEYRANAAELVALPEDATEQEREAAIDAVLAEAGITREKVYRDQWEAFVVEKTQTWAVSGVTVTEEEFLEAFNAQVEAEKATAAEAPDQYGLTLMNGETALYVPEGYREMDWIYMYITAEDMEKLEAISAAHDAAHTEAETCEVKARELLGPDADLDALVAQVTVTLAEVTDPANIVVAETVAAFGTDVSEEAREVVMALANARALGEAYHEQMELATEAARANLAPRVDEALRRLENGESWALVKEHYTDDAAMYAGTRVVREGLPYVEELFLDAAMSLTMPGEWTQGVYDDGYGCYIVYYVADMTPRAVDPETVRESMTAELLAQKQEESFSSTLQIWIDAASQVMYIDSELMSY